MRGRPVDMQRCLQVFDYIIEYKQAHDGNSPGARKIAEHANITTSQVGRIFKHLARDGMIRLGDGHCSVEVIGGRWQLEDPFTP